MTEETLRQVTIKPKNPILIDLLVPPLTPCVLNGEIRVTWGRSGHCAGGCWYRLNLDDKTVFYSGDYVEGGLVYYCDLIRGQKADIAILDKAYGNSLASPEENRLRVSEAAEHFLSSENPILIPVPKNGRGPELMALVKKILPRTRIFADEKSLDELLCLKKSETWIKSGSIELVAPELLDISNIRCGAIFITDTQLELVFSRELVKKITKMGGGVILTGACYPESYASRLLREGIALFARYPAHMSNSDWLYLKDFNLFDVTIPFHCAEYSVQQNVDV
jgi:hypothetical protein